MKREADGGRAPVPPPPLAESSHSPKPDGREATPDEVREAVAKAVPVLRVDAESARVRVLALAKRWGLSWVVAALDRAAAKQAVEPLRNPPGYLVRTLQGFRDEGLPPPPPKDWTVEEIRARMARGEAEHEAYIASLA